MSALGLLLVALALACALPMAVVQAADQDDGGAVVDQGRLLQQLAARVQYLEDMVEIQKLQSQYAQYLLMQRYDKILEDCFATKAEGIEIEFSDSGVYRGIESVRRLFKAFEETKQVAGFFTLHMTVNPYIVIARDGQSARSSWLSPGAASSPSGARWIWGPYYVDYVREDGRWKIRRSVFAPLFRTQYEQSWLSSTDSGTVRNSISAKPDGPPTLYRPFDKNRKDMFKDHPPLPEPY